MLPTLSLFPLVLGRDTELSLNHPVFTSSQSERPTAPKQHQSNPAAQHQGRSPLLPFLPLLFLSSRKKRRQPRPSRIFDIFASFLLLRTSSRAATLLSLPSDTPHFRIRRDEPSRSQERRAPFNPNYTPTAPASFAASSSPKPAPTLRFLTTKDPNDPKT